MPSGKLLKKLKGDTRFIPFNDNYDIEHIIEYLKGKGGNEEIYLKKNAVYSSYFNGYYNEFKSYFKSIVEENDLSRETFLELIITLANRDFYLLGLRSQKAISQKKEFSFDEIINSSVQSSIEGLGAFNAQAGLEAKHDGLNSIMNLTVKGFNDSENSNYDLNHLDRCTRLLGLSNIHLVLKSGYDMSVWEDYSLDYYNDEKELKIEIRNHKEQILNKIGHYRLERNLFTAKNSIISSFLEENTFYKIISKKSKDRRKAKRLKWVKIEDNSVKFKLADGIEKDSILKELFFFSSITTYYSFISNEKLPKLDNINLYDLLVIFSEIQHLFSCAHEIEKVENESNINSFNLHKLKIKRSDLINYVFLKTRYSINQINQIIDLLTHEDGYYNIWERPLIKFDEYLVPIMLPLLAPNTLRIIDHWLEQGGFDLDSRGILFEQFIKEDLRTTLLRKKYEFNIPDQNIFRNQNDDFEEIDLIIELKNITILAELKCIKFPFDPRDYHNMHKRLTEAAKQIKRKTDFIKQNIIALSDINYFSKPMVSLVITNYPIFSGIIIDNIPVTDFSLIENYFITGSLTKGISMNGGDNKKLLQELKYYTNEDEFCDNLEMFFKNPIPISDKIQDIIIEDTLISLPFAIPRIKMHYVKFKDENLI